MQECFRKYPDHYGAELTDDDDEVAEGQALESDAPSAVQGQAFEEHQAEAPEQHKASAEESGLKVVEQSVTDDGASKPSEIAVGAGNKDA